MPTEIEERNSAIANIFVEEFDAPLQILTADQDENGVVYGNLISSGEFYTYAFDNESIGVVHHQEETEELNEYAKGLLSGYGIKTDSLSPYEYTFGFTRTDAQVRCTKGGTPCGKVCLPKGSVCRKYGGGGGTGGSKLKSGGGAALAGGIAGGAAAVTGAAAVGGLAYINRKNLATGGKAVSERLKRAGSEGYGEAKAGLKAAKQNLQEGFKAAEELDRNLEPSERNATLGTKSLTRLSRRNAVSSLKGASIGGAVGATSAGIQNSAEAVGRNLKEAGKDIALTASNSVKTTSRTAKEVKEKFFGGKKPIPAVPVPPPVVTKNSTSTKKRSKRKVV